MNNLKEQRSAVKFCVKLGKSTTETFAMLNTAYGDVAMKRATCFRWHKRFKNDRLFVEDDERSGRLSRSTDNPHIDEINTLVRANRYLTARELAEECEISVGSCYHILTEELKTHRVAAKFVPHLITSDQQAHCVKSVRICLITQKMIKNSCQRSLQVMSYGFTVMTWKQESNLHIGQAKHPQTQKSSPSSIQHQVFFGVSGVVHHEYLPEGSTVNQSYYIEVLKCLRDAIRRKRPEL